MKTSFEIAHRICPPRHAVLAYLRAKRYVVEAGFELEIDWQAAAVPEAVSERECLAEAAWVILSAGMAEAVVGKVFPQISQAFLDWSPAQEIVADLRRCRADALCVFRHHGKIDAICQIAKAIHRQGHDAMLDGIREQGPGYLEQYPYFGPVTSLHFAKNLGFRVAKPDRHLVRMANSAGFPSVNALCELIAGTLGENVSVVDLVLWRYATLRRDAATIFQAPAGVVRRRARPVGDAS